MIEVRARAEFRADFPDDGLEDESHFLLFPGKGVTAAIADLLRGFGCEVSEPIHSGEHGWELDIAFKDETMWCQLTSMDVQENILLFLDGAFMGNYSGKPGYLEAIAKLNVAMRGDPRFHEISWQRWRDDGGPPANAPFDVGLDRLPKPRSRPEPRRAWFPWGAKEVNPAKPRPVKVRNKAKIGTSFPNDSTLEENGKIVRWGGQDVAVALAEILRRHGAEVSDPISAKEHGWRLDIRCAGQRSGCQIEDGGGFVYLDMDDGLVADHPEYVDLIVQLHAELLRDPRFHNIRWYRRDAIDLRGLSSNSPIGPGP